MDGQSRRKFTRRAPRSQWRAALSEVAAVPAKPDEDTPAQFLPQLIAALREKGYLQDEIVQKISSLRLGVTSREICAADRALRGVDAGTSRRAGSRPAHEPVPPTIPPTPSDASPGTATAPSVRRNGTSIHAGLAGDEELQRR